MLADLMELMASSQAWIALLTLTFMEVILGIDNIIFITIVAGKLPQKQQPRARNIGLLLAMVMRIALLFLISVMMDYLQAPLFTIDFWGLYGKPTGQSFILVVGGLFLLYKSIKEIHHKLEGHNPDNQDAKATTMTQVVTQITLINVVFSIDSILTAVGMTKDLTNSGFNALPVMVLGVILSVIIMIWFAGPIANYINKHPSVQLLALSFLILISFMLLAEGSHDAHAEIHYANGEDFHVQAIPKGYLYFAIGFSTIVQLLVIRMQKKSEPVQLHGTLQEAKERNILQ
jgi:predicted tellurium resistance membrane protein TerC